MICPKCGFEQPDGAECLRCGIVFSRYKGPVLGEARPAAAPPPLPRPPADPRPAPAAPYAPPQPAMAAAAGGTLHGPAVSGETLYEGPVSGAAAPSFGTAKAGAQGSFEVGKVLAETFAIFFRNFVPFLLLTAVALSPMIVPLVLLLGSPMKGMGVGMGITLVVLLVLSLILGPQLATASITYGVFQQMRGRDASFADCLSRGMSSLFPVLGLVILQGLGILAGLVACIIPGIILSLRWSVSVPAAVEERPGAVEALRRSTYLTDGHKGTIFAILFILNLLGNALSRLLALALNDDPSTLLMGIGAVIFLSTGVSATAAAVMYYRLRSLKESIDVDQIASVFA